MSQQIFFAVSMVSMSNMYQLHGEVMLPGCYTRSSLVGSQVSISQLECALAFMTTESTASYAEPARCLSLIIQS